MKKHAARALAVISFAGIAAVAGLGATAASAQTYPAKPIRWIVPYAAGGGSDFLARTVAQTFSTQVGQPVLVDNKPGGNTALGAAETARAPADGYTILSADNGTLVFNPALYKSLTYSPTKDLAPVTLMGKFPMILVVGANSGFASAKDFIAQARAKPGGINYASAGAGSPHHLAMELLKVEAKLFMVHVPYRGAAPALADVVGGQLPAMMVDLAAGSGFIKGGKVRALAVANATRLPQLPDVPTFAELGYPVLNTTSWIGLAAPAKTPPEVIAALHKAVRAVADQPAMAEALLSRGSLPPEVQSPAQFTAMMSERLVVYGEMVKRAGIRGE